MLLNAMTTWEFSLSSLSLALALTVPARLTSHLLHSFISLIAVLLQAEISKIMDLNVAPSRVIYANPCKQNSHIRYAANHDVALMTFDNISELHKVKANHRHAK